MYYLDSNTCIYYLNGRYTSVKENILKHAPAEIRIPVIVKCELLAGAYKSERKRETLKKVNAFLGNFEIEPFCDEMAGVYAQIRSDLELQGKKIGPNDTLIASIVKYHNGTLVTHNTKEFERVKGLKTIDWVV